MDLLGYVDLESPASINIPNLSGNGFLKAGEQGLIIHIRDIAGNRLLIHAHFTSVLLGDGILDGFPTARTSARS